MGPELATYDTSDESVPKRLGSAAILSLPLAATHEPSEPLRAEQEAAPLTYLPLTRHNFPDMYANLRESIERYVHYMFNLSPEDAEDVTANAFVKAFGALSEGKAIDNPTAWMYGIAKHTAIDLVRRYRIIRMESIARFPPEDRRSPLNIPAPEDDESYAEAVDRRTLLAHIFTHLRPRYATVLRLYDHEGYSYPEIMAIMHVNYANAKNLVNRGREQAKQLAAEYLSGHVAVKRRTKLAVD